MALEVGGEEIKVEIGHAAPWVADMDGDLDLIADNIQGGRLLFRQ